jgi:hypothetical protein
MIKSESKLNFLELALNDYLATVLDITRAEGTIGTIPYGTWVYNAIISNAPDRTGTDPVYRAQGIDCVVSLFGRFETDYGGAREKVLCASETLADELIKLRSTGINTNNLNQAFRGLEIRDAPIGMTVIGADNKSYECVATVSFSATYQYDNFSDIDPLWLGTINIQP